MGVEWGGEGRLLEDQVSGLQEGRLGRKNKMAGADDQAKHYNACLIACESIVSPCLRLPATVPHSLATAAESWLSGLAFLGTVVDP